MGYQVKWIEDNLGVSRKALRVYEDKGIMPKNVDRQYRDYSEKDIEKIWYVKVLQGIGYTLNEIAAMKEEFDFYGSITDKIKELEQKRQEAEQYLSYAKMIKLTGRIPTRPIELGKINWKEFRKKSLEKWNIENDIRMEQCNEIVERILCWEPGNCSNTDLEKLIELFVNLDIDADTFVFTYTDYGLNKAIIRRFSLGAGHPEVQLLVRIMYEELKEAIKAYAEFTPKQFGRLWSSAYMEGDIGKVNQQKYGYGNCVFLADAIAIFGGYENYVDSM